MEKMPELLSANPELDTKVNCDDHMAREEYKLIVAERRFIMTRYMQGLVFYPVIMGYAFRELLYAESLVTSFLFALFMVSVNWIAQVAAKHFRSMAYHALNREKILAEHFNVQKPHPMIWGYRLGVTLFRIAYILILAVIVVKVLNSTHIFSFTFRGTGAGGVFP